MIFFTSATQLSHLYQLSIKKATPPQKLKTKRPLVSSGAQATKCINYCHVQPITKQEERCKRAPSDRTYSCDNMASFDCNRGMHVALLFNSPAHMILLVKYFSFVRGSLSTNHDQFSAYARSRINLCRSPSYSL